MQHHRVGEVGCAFGPLSPVNRKRNVEVGEILNAAVERRGWNLPIALGNGQRCPFGVLPRCTFERIVSLCSESAIVPDNQVTVKTSDFYLETRAMRLPTLDLNLKERPAVLVAPRTNTRGLLLMLFAIFKCWPPSRREWR